MNNTRFKTHDFWLCSYLVSCGIPIASHKRVGTWSTFYFEESPRVQALVDSYVKLTARVEPSKLKHAMHEVRHIMYGDDNYTNTNRKSTDVTQARGSKHS